MREVFLLDRTAFEEYIVDHYGVTAEYPWMRTPTHAVYRHQHNSKWFAVVMQLPRRVLGMEGDAAVDVVNLKCDPLLMGSLLREEGIHRGYHMNKAHWITVRLDGSVDDARVHWLLDMSYDLTARQK